MYVCDVSIRPKCVFLAATIICPNVSLALLCFTAKQGCPEREEKNCATQTANPREILRTRNLGGETLLFEKSIKSIQVRVT